MAVVMAIRNVLSKQKNDNNNDHNDNHKLHIPILNIKRNGITYGHVLSISTEKPNDSYSKEHDNKKYLLITDINSPIHSMLNVINQTIWGSNKKPQHSDGVETL